MSISRLVLNIILISILWASVVNGQFSMTIAEDNGETRQGNNQGIRDDDDSNPDSYYNIFLDNQLEENVFFIRSIPYKRDYFKDDSIILKIGVKNNKQIPIYNVTIEDEIPIGLKLDKDLIISGDNNSEILSNISFANILGIYESNNNSESTINFDQVNSSECKYIKAKFKSNRSGKQWFGEATLSFKPQLHGSNISLRSPEVGINIIDRSPRVTQVQIKPNPAKKNRGSKYCEKISFSAHFNDLDSQDLARWEIWSSIDGRIGEGNINQKDNYDLLVERINLSEGNHAITFKVFDEDNITSSESQSLIVDEYIFNIIPEKYDWTILLAFIAILLEIMLKDGWKKLYKLRIKIASSIFLILIIASYISIISFLYLITFIIIIVFILYIFKYFRLNGPKPT